MKRAFAVTAAALLLSSGALIAQTPAPAPGTGSSVTTGTAPAAQPGTGTRNAETRKDDKIARGDRRFMQKAAEHGMFEVQIAQLAAAKAIDPQVKSFAGKLVDDHTAANNELVQLANSYGVELPAAPPRGMRRDIEKLGKKGGAEFDRDFVRHIGMKAHEKDIRMFERAARHVKDPQLRAWADRSLPKLREHLQMAQALPQSGKANAAAMGNRGPGGLGSGGLNPAGKGS